MNNLKYIGMRLTKEQLQEIKNEYGVDNLWSWSRLSAWHTSKYEYFLRYIDKKCKKSIEKNILLCYNVKVE